MGKDNNVINTAQELLKALQAVGREYLSKYPNANLRYGFFRRKHTHQIIASELSCFAPQETNIQNILSDLNTKFFSRGDLKEGELLEGIMSVLNRTEIDRDISISPLASNSVDGRASQKVAINVGREIFNRMSEEEAFAGMDSDPMRISQALSAIL